MPPGSTAGWGPADQFELVLTVLLIAAALLWRSRARRVFTRLAERPILSVVVVAILPIVLRLLLLPNHPVPRPEVYDEFSHLLAADTLWHLRLANPTHLLHRFFETFFVLQQPTYSSIYPPGQGLLLAFGRLISGVPWAGVLVCSGALCGCCVWALRGYVSPSWALLGGLLAIIQFGPLNQWTNSYWGGTLAATAGCLVFGGLPRIAQSVNGKRATLRRDALLLGVGFGTHMLTRPFETLLLSLSLLLFGALFLLRKADLHQAARAAAFAAGPVAAALLLIGLQNRAVTGRWTMLPEKLSQDQYGVPTSLSFEVPVEPHLALTREQTLDFRAQFLMHGPGRDTAARFAARLLYRVRYYRLFFLPPLYLALVAFLFRLREPIFAWVAATVAIFALGTNLFPYLLVHYLAGVTCLFVLLAVAGLERIGRVRIRGALAGQEIVQVLLVFCTAPFAVWYGIHFFESRLDPDTMLQVLQFETWDAINHRHPERRREVERQVEALPGKLLIFVHYARNHIYQNEWVWNAADIDSSRVVWARDLGAEQDRQLMAYYRDRAVFLFEPDGEQPTLTRVSNSPSSR